MNKIIKELDEYANKDGMDNDLAKLLRRAANIIEKQYDTFAKVDNTYPLLAHVEVNDIQKDKLSNNGFNPKRMALTIHSTDGAIEFNNGFLQLATFSLNTIAANIKASPSKSNLPSEISDYLIALGPWMQSFTNSYTVRNGSKEIEDFDLETFERVPKIRLA
jgi:hypothetical protein